MSNFSNYLNYNFLRDYSKNIEKKLDGLINKWEDMVRKETLEKSLNKIVHCLKTNDKFKLPWTSWEVKEAVLETNNLLGENNK